MHAMRCTSFSTVRAEIERGAAISALLNPSATSRSVAIWASVSTSRTMPRSIATDITADFGRWRARAGSSTMPSATSRGPRRLVSMIRSASGWRRRSSCASLSPVSPAPRRTLRIATTMLCSDATTSPASARPTATTARPPSHSVDRSMRRESGSSSTTSVVMAMGQYRRTSARRGKPVDVSLARHRSQHTRQESETPTAPEVSLLQPPARRGSTPRRPAPSPSAARRERPRPCRTGGSRSSRSPSR